MLPSWDKDTVLVHHSATLISLTKLQEFGNALQEAGPLRQIILMKKIPTVHEIWSGKNEGDKI